MKLCIFSGTFNPVHNAHLAVADFVIEKFGFDKILFIPAYKPPHKDFNPQMSNHRLAMTKLAVKNNPHFQVSDIEFMHEGKSYSYLTILELYKKFNIDGKINFIIGTDAFEKIETWYETDKLKTIVDFIVFPRSFNSVNLDYLKEKGYNFVQAELPFNNISSTDLREKIARQEPVSEFIPCEVEEYIKKNELYGYKKTT